MTEQDPLDPQPTSGPRSVRWSVKQKLALGAALVVLPGTVAGYLQLQKIDAQKENLPDADRPYDVSALRRVDPRLIGYREIARFETGVQSPTAMTVTRKGDVIVAGDGAMHRMSASGAQLQVITFDGKATCVTSDPRENVYLGFRDRVETYDPAGQKTATWTGFTPRSHLTSIAVADENVFIADAGERLVYRCDPSGRIAGKLAQRDESRGIPGLVVPSPHLDVAVGPDGLVWVANPGKHRLEAYSLDGQLERYWGAAGAKVEAFFGCCNPADFAILPDGSFITSEKGIARIKHHHADGRFDSVVVSPEAFGANRAGLELAANPAGHVLVLERGTRTVRVYDRLGGGPA
jgi:hypothetical protein